MSNLYNPTKEEVREFLDLAEGNESGIYPDPYLLPTHGLGIRLDDKNDAFLRDYIEALGINPDQQVPHYIYQNGGWIESQNETKTLIEELKYLFANKSLNPFHETQGIPSTSPVRMITTENQNIKAFDDIVYDAYLNSNTSYQIGGISSKFSNSVWEKLNSNERLALYSLNYNGGFNSSVREAIKLYTNQGASSTTGTLSTSQFIGKLHSWISILYFSNIRNDFGIENRRFIEANKFLGFNSTNTSSTISVTNFMEANIAISYMNQNYAIIKSRLNDFGRDYASNPNKYIRDNFSSAVSAFLSNQNYTQGYNINTLFTEWNLYTDLQINTSTGTTSYGNITGSDKRDLVFITGGEENTEVNTGKGDDEIYGTDAREIINSGNDDDLVNAGGGNNFVNGGSGNDTIIAGSGNDTIYCGTGRDYVDAGLGENHIYLGNDNSNDKVYIRGGINYIYDYSEYDYIELASGLRVVSMTQPENSKNIVLMLSDGGEIILVDAAKDEPPAEPDPSHPYSPEAAGEMPYLVFPNGNVMGWASSVGDYVDTGYNLPPLEGGKHLPENGEPVIPEPRIPTGETPPQNPAPKPDDRDPHDLPENEDAPEGSLKDPKSPKLPWNKQPHTGIRLSNVPADWYTPQTPIPEKAQGGFEGAEKDGSPLVLDLDGDGIETIGTDEKVYFDHENDGFAEKSGWVGKDDGLLVRDINNNGLIDDGTELFGNNSVLSSGQKAANGFEALADLDSNSDGVFNSSDAAWNQVKVWKDTNQNGKVDEGELLTLEQAA